MLMWLVDATGASIANRGLGHSPLGWLVVVLTGGVGSQIVLEHCLILGATETQFGLEQFLLRVCVCVSLRLSTFYILFLGVSL